jgi:hypothetical protein
LTINPTNGLIEWTPGEAQGPTNATVTVVVTDDNPQAQGNNQLSVTNSFTVTVQEINEAPELAVPADLMVHASTDVSLTATATDPDLPANGLSFSLLSGPSGLAVGTAGAINWVPGENQIGTNEVTIRVADDGSPTLGDTQSFAIVVVDLPVLDPPLVSGSNVALTWTAFDGGAYRVQYKGDLNAIGWSDLAGDVTATNSTGLKLDFLTPSNRLYRVRVLP